jgi:serine/threonine protein kinase
VLIPFHALYTGELLCNISPRGQLRTPGSKSLESVSSARRRDVLFLDFLARCLCWQPEARCTPESALQHPWLQGGELSGVRSRADTADGGADEVVQPLPPERESEVKEHAVSVGEACAGLEAHHI